jgi:lipoyl(octanoyl) transferase
MHMRACDALWLGRVGYDDGLELQSRAVAERTAGERDDTLFLLEHPHVYTLGRGADRTNVLVSERDLADRGAALYHTGRGGDVTYHGPGQLVGYPVISLKPDRCDVHRYVRDLEETLIRTIADFGITGERVTGLTGVWVGGAKVAAIGVRIARWVTSHGFALNVTTDLARFDAIVPCGIAGRGVTSIERLTGRAFPLDAVAERAARHFGEVFERTVAFEQSARLDHPAWA